MSAAKSSELSRRVLTGAVGGAVFLALVIFGGFWGVLLLTLILVLGMLHEFCGICLDLPDRSEKRTVLLIIAAGFVILTATLHAGNELGLFVALFLAQSLYFLLTASRHAESSAFLAHFRELVASVFGLVYLAVLPMYFIWLREAPNGLHWTLVFLFIVWAADIGAYFAGRSLGRHKLYPLISPKKTVEGAAGGLVSAFVVTLLYKLLAFPAMSWDAVIVIPVVVGAIAMAGDLVESFLKRAYGKKDSGSILPGHGGFLDRFDGVVFSLPVMYACLRVFGF